MSDFETTEDLPPVAHCTIAYLGPVAPHWEMRPHFGDSKLLDDFWARVTARLLLLPRHDPQFRRNRERVNRDAERELIRLDWDLGDEEPARAAGAPPVETAAVAAPPAETAIEATAADGGASAPDGAEAESAPVE